jgi:hypothetical protein
MYASTAATAFPRAGFRPAELLLLFRLLRR